MNRGRLGRFVLGLCAGPSPGGIASSRRAVVAARKSGRARVPARREDVPQSRRVFSSAIRSPPGLREPRIARTRSLPVAARPPIAPAPSNPSPFTVRLYDIRFDVTGGTKLAFYLEVRQSVGCDPASVSSRKGVLLEERNSKRRMKATMEGRLFLQQICMISIAKRTMSPPENDPPTGDCS